jgi:hypothetical protein
VYISKLDSAGEHIWSRSVGGSFIQRGFQVRETLDGGFAVAGWALSVPSGNSSAFYLVRVDSMGDTLFTRRYIDPLPNQQKAFCLGVLPDAGFVLAGSAGSPLHVKKVDAAGDTVWTRSYPEFGSGVIDDIHVLPSGEMILGGSCNLSGTVRALLLKLDAQGEVIWYRIYNESITSAIYAIASFEDHYVLTGKHAGVDDAFIYRVDEEGYLVWAETFDLYGNDYGKAIVATLDGGIAITGTTSAPGMQDIFLIKTNGDGDIITHIDILSHSGPSRPLVHPNPASTETFLSFELFEDGIISYKAFDLVGKIVLEGTPAKLHASGRYSERIDLSQLIPGVYLCEFVINGHKSILRIIRQ